MAMGEWISVQTSRELYERELRVETEELAAVPGEETDELTALYESRGLEPTGARRWRRASSRTGRWRSQVMAREELGIDPDAAGRIAVEGGGLVVCDVLPGRSRAADPVLLRLTRGPALIASVLLSAIVLLALGAAVTTLTGRSPLRSGDPAAAVRARSGRDHLRDRPRRRHCRSAEQRTRTSSARVMVAHDDHRARGVRGAMLADRPSSSPAKPPCPRDPTTSISASRDSSSNASAALPSRITTSRAFARSAPSTSTTSWSAMPAASLPEHVEIEVDVGRRRVEARGQVPRRDHLRAWSGEGSASSAANPEPPASPPTHRSRRQSCAAVSQVRAGRLRRDSPQTQRCGKLRSSRSGPQSNARDSTKRRAGRGRWTS